MLKKKKKICLSSSSQILKLISSRENITYATLSNLSSSSYHARIFLHAEGIFEKRKIEITHERVFLVSSEREKESRDVYSESVAESGGLEIDG